MLDDRGGAWDGGGCLGEGARGLTAVTVGNFDGVHLGHAELVRRARLAVGPEGRVVALAFWPHPMTVLRPERSPAALTGFAERSDLLREIGVDEVGLLEPTRGLLGTSADGFVRGIVERYGASVMVEGSDFRFGRGREGDVEVLRSIGGELGFETLVVDPVRVALSGGVDVVASSSLVRWLVERGRVADASRVLGRPYALSGEVVEGDRRGREIGVPTANLRTDGLLPADGVYAAVAEVGGVGFGGGGALIPAALHVGPKSTFDGVERSVEAHLIGWDGPGTAWPRVGGGDVVAVHEYGWWLRVHCLAYVRDQARYDGVGALCEQMSRDIERSSEIAWRYLAGRRPDGPAGAMSRGSDALTRGSGVIEGVTA